MATLKPTTPLLTPNKGPLKPASPLHPKNAPKTPISHPQRRRWFQLAHLTGPQRRRWFQTTRPPGRRSQAAVPVGGDRAWPNNKPTHRASSAHRAPLVWRAPEGPEGQGGLRGAAPNEVRSPSLAGGRALRRPEHQRHHKPRPIGGRRGACGAWPRCRWAAAGPGRASRRRVQPHMSNAVPPVWRAPEGPEGTGGLRGAAPNEVRSPSLAGGRGLRRPEHPWVHTAARPHRGRAAQQVSEAHRRITTMSGSPRPLSWRTLEIPSLAAISFAVPSMRGSS